MKSVRKIQRGAGAATLILVVAIAAIAAGVGYWYGTRNPPGPAVAQSGAISSSNSMTPQPGRKVLYWHDPMYPGQKFDKPGKSPFMDMDLVPVYSDSADDASVTISPRMVQSFGVRTVVAKEGTLASAFNAVGTVTVDERLIVAVQARMPGFVEKLHVRAQYDVVAAGQPLIDLYVPEWLAGEEELLALKASKQPGAAELVDAARQRLRQLGVPAAEIARAEREGKGQARVTIPAPESGIVWEIGARDGMAVMTGMTLFKIAGLDSVWVTADIPEAQAALAHTGLPVEARAAAYPDRIFKGAVSAMLPELNAATRTVRARIVLANPGGILKPGMYTNIAFGSAGGKAAVLVPAEALIRTGKRSVVIVDAGNGRFEPASVEVGRESGDLVEIKKGVEAGQRIVVSGQFLVDSEASLKGVLARLAASAPDQAPDQAPAAGATPPMPVPAPQQGGAATQPGAAPQGSAMPHGAMQHGSGVPQGGAMTSGGTNGTNQQGGAMEGMPAPARPTAGAKK